MQNPFLKTLAHLSMGATALLFSCHTLFAADISALVDAAKKEGTVNSVGMPDSWANWKGTWEDLEVKYGLSHFDTDMSSAEELSKFENEKSNASADIGDVGLEFGPIAVARDLVQPYKPTTWEQIPDWAKDKDGNWALAYTGTIAFIIKSDLPNPPKSWEELKNGNFKFSIAKPGSGAQENASILAAAIAMGGNEENLQPGIELFAKLAKEGRLRSNSVSPANLERGEIEVAAIWDFNALNYRDAVGGGKYTVLIPSDASVISGYTTVINKFAKNPNAAKLTREYIFSDEGQINLARGYARPIRIDHITLPQDVADRVLPSEQYKAARVINSEIWKNTAPTITQLWQENVLSEM
ncbi:ABC transporter substrate-binding protein [Bartonella sp. HY038]|uniref:ABC transporter substrate-binding protein n=1 Tax=Bartonella sp. HY038 TaxID=2759660 RepID=UPI0015FE1120|nr:extracellular solute-binding protein [Bartonella sp. HY038]